MYVTCAAARFVGGLAAKHEPGARPEGKSCGCGPAPQPKPSCSRFSPTVPATSRAKLKIRLLARASASFGGGRYTRSARPYRPRGFPYSLLVHVAQGVATHSFSSPPPPPPRPWGGERASAVRERETAPGSAWLVEAVSNTRLVDALAAAAGRLTRPCRGLLALLLTSCAWPLLLQGLRPWGRRPT